MDGAVVEVAAAVAEALAGGRAVLVVGFVLVRGDGVQIFRRALLLQMGDDLLDLGVRTRTARGRAMMRPPPAM